MFFHSSSLLFSIYRLNPNIKLCSHSIAGVFLVVNLLIPSVQLPINTHIMTQFFQLVAELGLPIAATVGMGVFILFIIKYILNGIVNSIKFIESVISQLDNRVKTMNNDILKIDQEVSEQLGLPIDTDRVARADGKTDARKD